MRWRPDSGIGPFATADPRMTIWLVLIGAGVVFRGAIYLALLYAVPYVVWPAAVALWRRDGGPPRPASRPASMVALGLGVAALSTGVVIGAGRAWWAVAVAGIVTGAMLAIVRRRA